MRDAGRTLAPPDNWADQRNAAVVLGVATQRLTEIAGLAAPTVVVHHSTREVEGRLDAVLLRTADYSVLPTPKPAQNKE